MAKNNNRFNRNKWWNNNRHSIKHNNSTSIPDSQEFKLTLPPPPADEIFKNRSNRQRPDQSIWGGEKGSVSYVPQRLESIEGKGNFVHYYGCPYPSKTIAPTEAIYATNPVKQKFINLLRLLSSKEMLLPLASLFLIGKKARKSLINKLLSAFNEESDMTLYPYYLQEGYYCGVVKEIRKFVESFLVSLGTEESIAKKTAEIIGIMFEYDNAYRFRIADILDEAKKEELLNNLPKEVNRLLLIEKDREVYEDHKSGKYGVFQKFKSGARLLKYAWILPPIKKKLKVAINSMDFNKLKLDEADIYHTLLYYDYNTRGKTLDERMLIYQSIHGIDQTKWPPRVIIRTTPPTT